MQPDAEEQQMIITTLGKRGRITLPLAIREALKLHEGDRIAFVTCGRAVLLQPLTQTLLDLRGSVPVAGPQDFAAIRNLVTEETARKATGSSV